MTLFRMELHPIDIADVDGTGEWSAVICDGDHRPFGDGIGLEIVGMQEIEPRLMFKGTEQRRSRRGLHVVPSHVGQMCGMGQRCLIEASDSAGNPAESRKLSLFAA